jgi:hypothetical protein
VFVSPFGVSQRPPPSLFICFQSISRRKCARSFPLVKFREDSAYLAIVWENTHNYRFAHLGSLVTAKLTFTTVRRGSRVLIGVRDDTTGPTRPKAADDLNE